MKTTNPFKSSIKFAGLLALVFLLFTGCNQGDSVVDGNSELTDESVTSEGAIKLKISTSPWPPDGLSPLALEKGFFEANGVDVEIVSVDGYEDMFKLIESGDLDITSMTLLDTVNYRVENENVEAILVQDYSAGADALVSMSPIKSLSDLNGKKIGAESGTVGEFFLQILLQREGLSLSDVELVDIASEGVLAALQDGTIDAGVCYEPCPSDVVAAGGVDVVNSEKERNLIVDVYVAANKEHAQANKDAYVKAMAAIVDAGEYYNQHPEESAQIMSEYLGMSSEEILATFDGLRIPDFRENKAAFNRSSGFSSLYNLATLASQYLIDQGLIDDSFDVSQVINSEFVESINR